MQDYTYETGASAPATGQMAFAIGSVGGPAQGGVASEPQRAEALSSTLHQLSQSLSAFTSSLDSGDTEAHHALALHTRLQPHARTVESAMHRLRELGLTRVTAATELSQSLTVLVLVSDMISSGQLTDMASSQALLRRNAYRAAGCLYELRQQLASAA